MDYEWDEAKNQINVEKHKVGFEEARTVFDDPYAIELEATHKGEYRLIRIGKTASHIILIVVYTLRGTVIRLISARQANKSERSLYLEYKLKHRSDEGSHDKGSC
ncbi:MAG: BrnT family toxin [Saprospiraceae bacterium]|nr:BrnT family toxin [Saprospiraceae bacterium]MDW8228943.1 BrnT family toxin [Saprospiraceae bacterium]